MTQRIRRILFTPAAVGCVCLIAACGSSSSKSSPTSPGASGIVRPAGLKITTSEQTCLRKHGVTLPSGGHGHFGGGKPPTGSGAGTPPTGAGGTHARHRFPKGAAGAGGFATQEAALKACGVSLPFHHPGGTSGPSAG
jgi:hypothetical protein